MLFTCSKTEFIEQEWETGRSTLYSFDKPFQLLYVNPAHLEFSGKSSVDFKYCLLFVYIFTSRIYAHPLKPRRLVAKKMS